MRIASSSPRLCLLGLCLLLAPAALAQNTTPLFVTANPGGGSSDALQRVAPNLSATTATFNTFGLISSIESIAFGGDDAFITFDAVPGRGGILIADDVGMETTGRMLEVGDRLIYGDMTGLVAPKGLIVMPSINGFLVADFGAGDLKAFSTLSSGNTAPLFTVGDLGTTMGGMARKPWDVAYDVAGDRLFVAGTDGVVAVFDAFSTTAGAGGPSRTITPTDGTGKISVNLHGIAYSAGSDYLLLSDVGSAASPTDGQIFVIANAATASGMTAVRYSNGGNNTALGNPVDVAFDGTSLFVAEKSNSMVQRYDDILTRTGMENAAPNASTAAQNAESVDFTSSGVLFATANPAGRDMDAALRLAGDLSGTTATFDGIGIFTSIESVSVTPVGTAALTFDGRTGGGFFYIDDLNTMMMGEPVGLGDGFVYGSMTGLVAPKGLVGVPAIAWMLIADVGASDIKAFPWLGMGNIAPTFTVSNLGMTATGSPRAVWDIAYDALNDRLYGAGTDGVVVVFDQFALTQGASGPSRTITPTDGTGKISVNLHGIEYIGGLLDLLLLTDVGSAASATDGQLFTIANASTADGPTAVRYRNGGSNTMLGNPVDVATDGRDAYVAEKSNSLLLRFDSIQSLMGMANTAPDAMVAIQNAESVTFASMMSAACADPSTAPSYAGGYVLNSAGTRAFVQVTVPQGGTRFMFYNTVNLNVGSPEMNAESGMVLTGFTRTGMTFDFAPAASPMQVFFPITTAGGGTGISFFLRVTDTCGRVVDVDPAFTITGVEGDDLSGFALAQSSPNPTAGAATIRFSLDRAAEVRLRVFDVLGREVARLVDETREAGAHSVRFGGEALPAGLYVYRLEAGGRTLTRTLTLAH